MTGQNWVCIAILAVAGLLCLAARRMDRRIK